jgi:hypothetical protein
MPGEHGCRILNTGVKDVYCFFVPFFCTSPGVLPVQKSALLAAIQKEIQRQDLSYFVDEPPSVAQGGRGVVVSGCPACKKRINTISQFLDHLSKDASAD